MLVIEPDSLPNLSTAEGDPHSGNSAVVAAYKTGITYAVQHIAELVPSVSLSLYADLDSWLG